MASIRRGPSREGPLLLVIGLLVLSAALAPGCSRSEPSERGFEGMGEAGIDWDNPIDGMRVDSVDEAEASVTFDILVPQSLGTPTDILVTDFPPQPESVVAFMYDHPQFGQVVVEEHIPDVDPREYVESLQKLVDASDQPNAHGTADLIAVRGGDPALLTTSEDGSVSELWWLHDSVIELIVRGPTLDAAACLAIAELI